MIFIGDLSNLIGLLSRTIQQYSPPSEWIICELGVFPIFLENDLLNVDRILGLTYFNVRKDLEGVNTAFFNLLQLSFVLDGLFTTPVYNAGEETETALRSDTVILKEGEMWGKTMSDINRYVDGDGKVEIKFIIYHVDLKM